jgi:Glutathione S-transferase, N-terminal domain
LDKGSVMSGVTVYGTPLSPAVARVLACLFEKEVDFKLSPVDMAKGQHKSPDFLKLQVSLSFFLYRVIFDKPN